MSEPQKKNTFRATFFTGLFVLMPVLITLWIVEFIFKQLNGAITPHMQRIVRAFGLEPWLDISWIEWLVPIASICIALFSIYLLGLLAGNVLGKQLLKMVEYTLDRIPFVRSIYSSTRQFLQTFSNRSASFNRVVLVEYPRPKLWTLALVTSEVTGEVKRKSPADMVSIFIPTTPNPTSGWLLFVAQSDIIDLDMSVDDAFKMIISGGVLTPPESGTMTPRTE